MRGFSCLTQETTTVQHKGNHENACTTQKLFLSFFSPIESDWREGWWIATVLVRRSGTDTVMNLFRQLIQNAVTARTNASQRTLCSAHGTAVRLWQAVSHSMSSNGRPSRKFIYSAMQTVEPKREPIVGLMNKWSIMKTCHWLASSEARYQMINQKKGVFRNRAITLI